MALFNTYFVQCSIYITKEIRNPYFFQFYILCDAKRYLIYIFSDTFNWRMRCYINGKGSSTKSEYYPYEVWSSNLKHYSLWSRSPRGVRKKITKNILLFFVLVNGHVQHRNQTVSNQVPGHPHNQNKHFILLLRHDTARAVKIFLSVNLRWRLTADNINQ